MSDFCMCPVGTLYMSPKMTLMVEDKTRYTTLRPESPADAG